jgi:hypothetical protein
MSKKPPSGLSSSNSYDLFFRCSIFRSGVFCLTTFVLGMGLLDGGIILVRRRLDAAAAFMSVLTVIMPVFFWIRILIIHRKTRELTAGSKSAETAAVLQILAQTLVTALLLMSLLMIMVLSQLRNAPR